MHLSKKDEADKNVPCLGAVLVECGQDQQQGTNTLQSDTFE